MNPLAQPRGFLYARGMGSEALLETRVHCCCSIYIYMYICCSVAHYILQCRSVQTLPSSRTDLQRCNLQGVCMFLLPLALTQPTQL